MEAIEVSPHWILSKDYNDKNSGIDGQIVVKVITKFIKDSGKANLKIVVLGSNEEANKYFFSHIKGRIIPQNYKCFMTYEYMLKEALNEKYTNIPIEWLAKKITAIYWCILLPV